jgi:hypothetical protein
MDAGTARQIEKILYRKQISTREFHRVEMLGDEGFDFVKSALSHGASVQTKINGLKLLLQLGRQQCAARLPEVFDIAATLSADSDRDVRTMAARVVVAGVTAMRMLSQGLGPIGGEGRVRSIIREITGAGVNETEHRALEELGATLSL